MALTKDDLQAIGSVIDERVPAIIEEQVRPLVKEEVNGAIQEQVRPLFEAQNKFIARGFADLKDVVKDTYVSRDELEGDSRPRPNERAAAPAYDHASPFLAFPIRKFPPPSTASTLPSIPLPSHRTKKSRSSGSEHHG